MFAGCNKLSSVNLNNDTQIIPTNAFAGSGITSITLPENVTTIGDNAFSNITNLSSISFKTAAATNSTKLDFTNGTKVNSIGANAFGGVNKVTEADLSKATSLTTIPTGIFSGSSTLATVTLPESITTISTGAFSKNGALSKLGFKTATSTAGKLDFTNGTNVSSIGENAFDGTAFTEADLSKATALATIGANAFSNTKLTTVDLSKTIVTTIGANAFSNNTQLESIKLPATVTSNTANIANNVKEGFTLSYPDGITVSGTETTANSFNNNQLLTDVDLSKSADLTTLLADTFSGSTKLSKVVLPAKAVKWNLNTTNNGGNPFFNNADTLNIEFTAFKKSDGSTAPTDFANIDDSVKTQIANIMNIFSRYVATADSVHPVQYSEWTPGTNNSNFWINTDLTKDTVFKSWTNGSTALPDLTDTNGVTKNHNGVTWTYKKDASNNITIESDSAQTPINIYRAGTSFDSSTNVLSSGKQTYFSSPIAGPNSAPNNTKVKVTLRIVTQ